MSRLFEPTRANRLLSCQLIALVLALTTQALATLGQDLSSVQSDQAHLKASVRIVHAQNFSVHEMQTPTGTTIKQYVSSAGTVFAVSWQGAAPDLRQLLGEYFDQYVTAAAHTAHGGRGVHIDNGEFVFESAGHMRFVVGRAFLRSKMPQQVSSDAIR